jgi:RimJ/RimL family protein N-acetyltransferase
MRYFPGPLTRQASDALADRIDAGIAQDGWGLWAPHELATGRFLGFTGLSRATFEAPFTPAVEVGWRLARAAWGSGFASEAAHAATACGFDVLGLDEIVSFTAEGNARSRAVMRRLGMRRAPLGRKPQTTAVPAGCLSCRDMRRSRVGDACGAGSRSSTGCSGSQAAREP